jgi:hypothetical protein
VDERKAREIGGLAQSLLDQARRTHRQHRILEQFLGMKIGHERLLSRIAMSTPSAEKSATFMVADTRVSIVGMRAQEAPQPRHQPLCAKPGVARDDQMFARAPRRADRPRCARFRSRRAARDRSAGRHRSARSRACGGGTAPAELLLQRADLVAERGRRDVQLLGRLGEAQMARDRLEGRQRVERRQRLRS